MYRYNIYIIRRYGIIANKTTLHQKQNEVYMLTTICHRTAFNDDRNPCYIVSYIRVRNEKCKTI